MESELKCYLVRGSFKLCKSRGELLANFWLNEYISAPSEFLAMRQGLINIKNRASIIQCSKDNILFEIKQLSAWLANPQKCREKEEKKKRSEIKKTIRKNQGKLFAD